MNIDRSDFVRLAWLEGEQRAAVPVAPRRTAVRKFDAGSLKLAFAGQR